MMKTLQTFDIAVERTFFSIIEAEGIDCSAQRMMRASLKASLPAPRGCGLFKAADPAPALWWSSVSSSLSDPLLFKLRTGLAQFTQPALLLIQQTLGGPSSSFWNQISFLFPADGTGLLNGTYSPDVPNKTKFNQVFLRAVKRLKVSTLDGLLTPEVWTGDSLTASDVVNGVARSASGRIFTESLKRSAQMTLFTNNEYTAFCRFFLGLPPKPTIGEAKSRAGFDYPVECCKTDHGSNPFLDAAGNHACSNCPSTYKARQKKHRDITLVLAYAAKEAGLTQRPEPSTHNLLLGEFTKEQCRKIFPKSVTNDYKIKFQQLMDTVDAVEADRTSGPEQKQALIQSKIDLLPARGVESNGLRIDLELVDTHTDEVKWIDVTAVHTTCDSYISDELKSVIKRKVSGEIAEEMKVPDVVASNPSPTLLVRETSKKEKYSRLVCVAKKQFLEGKRRAVPQFTPFALADNGELTPTSLALQEWIVQAYRRKTQAEGPRADGLQVSQLVVSFRHRLKLAVQFALASGVGAMINAAGRYRP
jgi:hypothetical protein